MTGARAPASRRVQHNFIVHLRDGQGFAMGHCRSLQAAAEAESFEWAVLIKSVRWTCRFTCMPQTVACCLGYHTDPPLPWLLMASQAAAMRLQRKKARHVDFSCRCRGWLSAVRLHQEPMADTRSPSLAKKRPAEDSYATSGRWQHACALGLLGSLSEVLCTGLTLPRHNVLARILHHQVRL